MTNVLRPDLCVIGASEAGRAVAMGAVALGFSVIVVDDGDPAGGRNRDLTLELLRSAARAEATAGDAWRRLRDGLRRAAAERSHARLAAMNIPVLAATGRFRDPETLEAAGTLVRGRRFVIATGRARPAGASVTQPLEALPDLASRPDHLWCLGGGPDVVSAAQSLARLGTAVTLRADVVLPGVDAELAAPILARLRQDGIVLVRPDAALPHGPPCYAEAESPALADLGLGAGAVAQTGRGLTLTAGLRTTNPRVFAVGCPAGAASTAAGLAQVGVVLRQALLRLPVRLRPDLVSTTVPCDPELAQVGLTEAQAQDRGAVAVWRWPLGQTGPGIARGGSSGHVKVVTDRRGRILGAGVVGPEAREMIGFWTLALARRLSLADLGEVPIAFPSWSEAVRGIVLGHTARRLSRPWIRRSLAVARRLV